MKVKKEYLLLFILFLLVLCLRLHYSFEMDEFSSDNAYFHLKGIEYFSENFEFMIYDELSYSGREVLYPPVFHSFLGVLGSDYGVLKFVPELLLSLLVVIVFFLAKEISGSSKAALVSAFLSAFIPLFITETLNQISVYSFVLPLLFFLLYCFLKVEYKLFFILYLVGVFIFSFLHSSVFLLLLSLIAYLIIMYSEGLKVGKVKKEVVFFTFFTVFLLQFIIYKKAFFRYGFGMIWQNVPSTILHYTYKPLTGFGLIFALGVIPLLFGIFGLYYGLFRERTSGVYLVSSLIFGLFLLLVFRLLQFGVGLMILGLALSVLGSVAVVHLKKVLVKTKFSGFWFVFLFVLFLAVFVPGLNALKSVEDVPENVIGVLHYIEQNSRVGEMVLGNVYEGNIINYFAHRPNVIDSNFILAKRPVQRVENVHKIYTTGSQAKALELLKRYNVDFIFLSDQTRQMYDIEELNYVASWRCIDWVGEDLYEVKC